MKIILAGFNLDKTTINEFRNFIREVAKKLDKNYFLKLNPLEKQHLLDQLSQKAYELIQRNNFTPETISAAYARISRNPKPVNELREIARQEVDRARKSNQNIIFGLGHSSVAEHATFNFDVIGISRLAVETIEHFRLASYTEKSQRYILFQDDFTVPQEIKNTNFEKEFISLIREQNQTYHQLYKILRPYFFKKYSVLAENPDKHPKLEGLAKEDARYVISLATQTQLGMTVNARTLENMISKCATHPLAEVREYAKKLYDATEEIAPSIIKYTEPSDYQKFKRKDIYEFISHYELQKNGESQETEVELLEYPENADDEVLSTLLFRFFQVCKKTANNFVKSMNLEEKKVFYQTIYKNINSWDSVLREFEFVNFTFQLIVSAGNYGQLKRHRMVSIIPQDYDISLGCTVPESIKATGQEYIFWKIIEKTNKIYEKLHRENPQIASYVLTNSHRRRVLLKINLRELYHFSRLREDEHAQWDIRQIATKMHNLVADKLPLAAALLGGKDKFKNVYEKFMKA